MSDVNYDSEQTDARGDAENFQLAQSQCKTLEHLWTRARTGSSEVQIIGGLLYKKIPVNITSTNEYALVVPQVFTHELITLAHDSMIGGHMGCRKTRQRIEAYFFWPKMHKMISSHVRTCHECQLVKPLKVKERQPLEPITIHTHAWDDRQLTVQQQRQLTDLLSEYTDEYSETTRKCDFVRYTTRPAIERPIWQEGTIRTHVWDRTIT